MIIASPIFPLLLVLIFLNKNWCLVPQLHPALYDQALLSMDTPVKNTGVGGHFLLQGNLPEPDLPYPANPPTSPVLAGGFFTTEPLGFS